MKLQGKAGDFLEEFLSVVLKVSGAKEALIPNLTLKIENETIEARMASKGEVCVVLYKSKTFDIDGEGMIILEANDILSRLSLYPKDEKIEIKIEGKDVIITGEKLTSRLRQTDVSYKNWYDKKIKTEKGMILFKSGAQPSAKVKIKGSELSVLPAIEKIVDIGVYNLHFSPKESFGYVGDLADPTTKPIKQIFDAVVKGKAADVTLSYGARELFSNLNDDEYLLGAETNTPIWLTQKRGKCKIAYLLAPMTDGE